MAEKEMINLIGSIAAFCTTVSFLPQVVRIHRTKRTHDLSLPMYAIFSCGVLLWLCYGLMTMSVPIITANAIAFILSIYILAMKVKYK